MKKKCNICQKVKSVSEFDKRYDTKSTSYSYRCKRCRRKTPKTDKELERNRENQARWRKNHPEFKNLKPYQKKVERVRCERCGFIPEDVCQLDVDHIDGNHKNNDVSNLSVLCANCHRLKSYYAKVGLKWNFLGTK